jgi:hypothetical protein
VSEELAPEDLLRLQVLLAQDIKAIRLDESKATLLALTPQGEVALPLHPVGRSERYFRAVRELLSGHALGSPGGYPVYLTRWTRHGQMETTNLGKLLLTGEPEAVVAVVHSPALTDELAAYAWWAMPTIENARLMLRREEVARGHMGRILAGFLLEHLPFLQDDHVAIMDTVAVLLASATLGEEEREVIWRRGRRTNTYYVAFLELASGALPVAGVQARVLAEADERRLADLADGGNVPARILRRACSARGQAFLAATAEILGRPETQEVVNRTLNALGAYFRPDGHPAGTPLPGLDQAQSQLPGLASEWLAVAHLSQVSDALVTPIFARSTAIGSLMRRKIEPVSGPILEHIRSLGG